MFPQLADAHSKRELSQHTSSQGEDSWSNIEISPFTTAEEDIAVDHYRSMLIQIQTNMICECRSSRQFHHAVTLPYADVEVDADPSIYPVPLCRSSTLFPDVVGPV
jgi:hypothetical protein